MKRALTAACSSLLIVLCIFGVGGVASASVGVSINTGKIVLDKSVVPGGMYDLPSVQVANSGTEPSDYGISVEYNEVQSQFKPDASWLHFSPATFHLLPGEVKLVTVSLVLPATAAAGDYFAYVEAHSINANTDSHSAISGAAATKLYFTVGHSNVFKTAYYTMLTFIRATAPVSYGVLWIVAIGILYFLVQKIRRTTKKSLSVENTQ